MFEREALTELRALFEDEAAVAAGWKPDPVMPERAYLLDASGTRVEVCENGMLRITSDEYLRENINYDLHIDSSLAGYLRLFEGLTTGSSRILLEYVGPDKLRWSRNC